MADLQKLLASIESRPDDEPPARVPSPPDDYDDLGADEVVGLLPSLDRARLEQLRRHEAHGQQRPAVMEAIDRLLAGSGAPDGGR